MRQIIITLFACCVHHGWNLPSRFQKVLLDILSRYFCIFLGGLSVYNLSFLNTLETRVRFSRAKFLDSKFLIYTHPKSWEVRLEDFGSKAVTLLHSVSKAAIKDYTAIMRSFFLGIIPFFSSPPNVVVSRPSHDIIIRVCFYLTTRYWRLFGASVCSLTSRQLPLCAGILPCS